MRDTIINCKSRNEYNRVLEKLEKLGCKWASGHNPTEITKYYGDGFKILFVANDRISAGSPTTVPLNDSEYKNYERINADAFIGNKPIVIYQKDRTVIAVDKNTGKKCVAKCHPDDEFDFYTGAKLAFSRLSGCSLVEFDGEPKSDASDDTDTAKFNVGDTVKVKSELEVGCIYYGSSSPLALLRDMKTNEPLKIESIKPSGNYLCNNGFHYTPDMLEPYTASKDKFKTGDKVALCTDVIVGNMYGGLNLLDGYMSCFGSVLTITSVKHPVGNIPTRYKCDNGFIYSEEMLVGADDAIIIGSKIKVVDSGFAYDTYWQWVDKNIKEPRDKIRYAFQGFPEDGDIGKVIAIAPHINGKEKNLIYFECEDNNCYLIEPDGVKKIQ